MDGNGHKREHPFDERVIEYAYGELSPAEEAAFRQVLETSPELQHQLADLQLLRQRVDEVKTPEPHPEVVADILAHAASRRRVVRTESAPASRLTLAELFRWLMKPQVGLAMTALLVVAIGVYVGQEAKRKPEPGSPEAIRELARPSQVGDQAGGRRLEAGAEAKAKEELEAGEDQAGGRRLEAGAEAKAIEEPEAGEEQAGDRRLEAGAEAKARDQSEAAAEAKGEPEPEAMPERAPAKTIVATEAATREEPRGGLDEAAGAGGGTMAADVPAAAEKAIEPRGDKAEEVPNEETVRELVSSLGRRTREKASETSADGAAEDVDEGYRGKAGPKKPAPPEEERASKDARNRKLSKRGMDASVADSLTNAAPSDRKDRSQVLNEKAALDDAGMAFQHAGVPAVQKKPAEAKKKADGRGAAEDDARFWQGNVYEAPEVDRVVRKEGEKAAPPPEKTLELDEGTLPGTSDAEMVVKETVKLPAPTSSGGSVAPAKPAAVTSVDEAWGMVRSSTVPASADKAAGRRPEAGVEAAEVGQAVDFGGEAGDVGTVTGKVLESEPPQPDELQDRQLADEAGAVRDAPVEGAPEVAKPAEPAPVMVQAAEPVPTDEDAEALALEEAREAEEQAKAEQVVATVTAKAEKKSKKAADPSFASAPTVDDGKKNEEESLAAICDAYWNELLALEKAGKEKQALKLLALFRTGQCKGTRSENDLALREANIYIVAGKQEKARKILRKLQQVPAMEKKAMDMMDAIEVNE